MKHYMSLDTQPFEKIKSGTKTIELRLYDEKRRLIRPGEEIEFKNNENEETLLTKVRALHIYENFAALYRSPELTKCGYNEDTVKTADPQDMEKYYSKEAQKKYGVVGIELELTANKGEVKV